MLGGGTGSPGSWWKAECGNVYLWPPALGGRNRWAPGIHSQSSQNSSKFTETHCFKKWSGKGLRKTFWQPPLASTHMWMRTPHPRTYGHACIHHTHAFMHTHAHAHTHTYILDGHSLETNSNFNIMNMQKYVNKKILTKLYTQGGAFIIHFQMPPSVTAFISKYEKNNLYKSP